MKDSRMVHRRFVTRREAQWNWQQLFRVLLEVAGAQLALSEDTPTHLCVIHTEVPCERCCLRTGLRRTVRPRIKPSRNKSHAYRPGHRLRGGRWPPTRSTVMMATVAHGSIAPP